MSWKGRVRKEERGSRFLQKLWKMFLAELVKMINMVGRDPGGQRLPLQNRVSRAEAIGLWSKYAVGESKVKIGSIRVRERL
jgi:hypothetical protein